MFNTILIFYISICSIFIIALIIDLFFYYRSVFFRLKIGRWKDKQLWNQSIQNKNLAWLQKTPIVKLTDNNRYIILDLIKGHYRNSTIQSWQEAGTLIGALASKSEEKVIKKFVYSKIDIDTGSWKTIPKYVDGTILAYALTKTKFHESLKPAFNEIIQLIEKNKGIDGTIFYRPFIPNIRFVDTIGFVCPFLTWYGVTYNQSKYIDLAILQIKDYINKAFLINPFITAHAFDIKQNIPLGIYGWGRGMGWFIIGIVDMYNELPNNHHEKIFLKETIIKTAETILNFQNINGGFNSVLSTETRHDSSITTIAGWLFINSYKITKNKEYLKATDNCIESLMKVTRRDGAIDFSQGDTKGIGVYASTFDIMPFTQGLTVRLVESIDKFKFNS